MIVFWKTSEHYTTQAANYVVIYPVAVMKTALIKFEPVMNKLISINQTEKKTPASQILQISLPQFYFHMKHKLSQGCGAK